jgi:hypothetical protein
VPVMVMEPSMIAAANAGTKFLLVMFQFPGMSGAISGRSHFSRYRM